MCEPNNDISDTLAAYLDCVIIDFDAPEFEADMLRLNQQTDKK